MFIIFIYYRTLGIFLRHPPPIEVGSITVEEVQETVKTLKTNKAPGPDGMVTELYKHLDEDNIKNLAQILNQMWTEEKVTTDFTQADVVSIYKKGNAELPQNYRPISLLNTSYKILTKIYQTRLSNAIDRQLHDTQFGFRKGRSTSEALFCVRRLQDLGEAGLENIIPIFLDWEKAFDKVSHTKPVWVAWTFKSPPKNPLHHKNIIQNTKISNQTWSWYQWLENTTFRNKTRLSIKPVSFDST